MFILPRTDDDDVTYQPSDARISQSGFMIVAWTLTWVSFVFLVVRLATRLKFIRGLKWDDFLAVLAWVLLLVYTIIWQIKIPLLYWQIDVVHGRRPLTLEFLSEYATFQPLIAVWSILFYCSLWSVKFSFLIFFRQLGSKIRAHRIWWWVVMAVTIAGLAACLGDPQYKCTVGSLTYIIVECTKASRAQLLNRLTYVNCAIDILTDILILSIPILILWNVQIPRKKKLVLYVLFSATILTIITAIIRAALMIPDLTIKKEASIDWLYLWGLVEMSVVKAIMISSTASFRQLFVGKNNRHLYGNAPERRDPTGAWHRISVRFIDLLSVFRKGRTSRATTEPSGPSPMEPGARSDDAPPNKIRVQTTVALRDEETPETKNPANSAAPWTDKSAEC